MVKYDLLKTYRIPAISSRTPADGFVVTAHDETRKKATKRGAKAMSRHGRGLRDKSRGGSIAQRLEQRTAFQLGKRKRCECNQRHRDNPAETVGYCVASRWGEGDGALLVGDALRIKTSGERSSAPPVYFLPPPEFDDSVVTIEATLRVVRNDTGLACTVNVNCANEVLFYPDRVEILNRPYEVYYLDGTKYHDYTIIRDATRRACW